MVTLLIPKQRYDSIWKVKLKLLALSVISSLALPYSSTYANDSLVSTNQAVFRLSGVVFFSSDIQESIEALNIFKCLGAMASERSFTEIYSSGDFKSIPKNQAQVSDDLLLTLIKIEKLKIAALGRSRDRLSQKELSKLSKKCGKLKWDKLSDEQKSLLIAEIFLRDRFAHEKDVYNRLAEYSRSLSIQEGHELYARRLSKGLQEELNQERALIIENQKLKSLDIKNRNPPK